jgi:hypothetical protein
VPGSDSVYGGVPVWGSTSGQLSRLVPSASRMTRHRVRMAASVQLIAGPNGTQRTVWLWLRGALPGWSRDGYTTLNWPLTVVVVTGE